MHPATNAVLTIEAQKSNGSVLHVKLKIFSEMMFVKLVRLDDRGFIEVIIIGSAWIVPTSIQSKIKRAESAKVNLVLNDRLKSNSPPTSLNIKRTGVLFASKNIPGVLYAILRYYHTIKL